MPGDEVMTAARYRALQGLSIPPKGEAEPMAKRAQPAVSYPEGAIRLTLPYPPSSNRYWRNVNGRMVLSSAARDYRREVSNKAAFLRLVPTTGPVRLSLWVFRPRRAGDLMNREKVLSDALEGIAYVNDSQIHEAHLYLGDDKLRPRVEVLVEALDTSGTTKATEGQ